MINMALLLFASISLHSDSGCAFTISDKHILLSVESKFYDSETLLTTVEVKNVSKQIIYLIKDGFSPSEIFPLNTTLVNMDLTDSKLRAGNGHYIHSMTDLQEFLPDQNLSFSFLYSTPVSEFKKITFVYEYLLAEKKVKNNKILGKDLVRLAQKLKVECPCYFNNK